MLNAIKFLYYVWLTAYSQNALEKLVVYQVVKKINISEFFR